MDYTLKSKNLNKLKIWWSVFVGRLKNINLDILLINDIPENLRNSYIENENKVRDLTGLDPCQLSDLAKRKNTYCIVHNKDTVIGSIIVYSLDANNCILNLLHVSENYRNRNIAKWLTASIIKHQIKINPNIITFRTDPSSEIARKILSNLNFTPR